MVLNREQAVQRANNFHSVSKVGICQLWTRELYEAPSVGDVDHDRDSDAVDGWKFEPEKWCHYGDRTPPRGVPLFFKGGSKGYGHRCISLGDGLARSTDMRDGRYTPYAVGNATIAQIEQQMNMQYVGWSESISGILIPLPRKTRIELFLAGKPRYNLRLLDNCIAKTNRKDEALIRKVRDGIVHQIGRLPHDKDASLVNRFVADFEEERLVRLGLLNVAIGRGRMGVVRQVRDQIRELISQLPAR